MMGNTVAQILIIVWTFVSVVIACFWLFPANNGISGEWFQAAAAGTLTMEGMWSTHELRENNEPWLRSAAVTVLGIGLCIATLYNFIQM